MKLFRCVFLLFCLFVFFGCQSDSSGDSEDMDDDESGGEYTQEIFFPTVQGSKWVYEKRIHNPQTGDRTDYLYLALDSYDSTERQYTLTLKRYIKRIKIYGSPDGMSDLITYEIEEIPVLLRNGNGALEYFQNGVWVQLYSSKDDYSFTFSSFCVTCHADMTVNTIDYSGYIDSLPFNELGFFTGRRTEGYTANYDSSVQKKNMAFFNHTVGLIESSYSDYVHTDGLYPYFESSTTTSTEYVELLGYNVGAGNIGKDVDEIEYSEIYEY